MTALSLFILAALVIADTVLTVKILRLGGRELNGIMRALMQAAGSYWGVVKYGISIAASLWAVMSGHAWLIWPSIGIMILVVQHNFTEWRRAKRGQAPTNPV